MMEFIGFTRYSIFVNNRYVNFESFYANSIKFFNSYCNFHGKFCVYNNEKGGGGVSSNNLYNYNNCIS